MLTQIHGVISNSTMLFFLLLGLWGLVRAVRNLKVEASYLGALVIGEALFVVQALIGGLLFLSGEEPGRQTIHLIYGAFALVALPGLFSIIKGDDSNQAQWYYAILTLFLFGVATRAISTGV